MNYSEKLENTLQSIDRKSISACKFIYANPSASFLFEEKGEENLDKIYSALCEMEFSDRKYEENNGSSSLAVLLIIDGKEYCPFVYDCGYVYDKKYVVSYG